MQLITFLNEETHVNKVIKLDWFNKSCTKWRLQNRIFGGYFWDYGGSSWGTKCRGRPEGFQEPWESMLSFLSWLLNTKQGHKTCTFRSCLDPELSLSPCHVWGLQLVSWEVFAKLLLQEGVVANVPCSAARRRCIIQLVKMIASQNRKEELFMHFYAVLEVLRGHDMKGPELLECDSFLKFPEIVIISQWSTRGAVAMWSKNENTKPFIAIAFIEIFDKLPRSLAASTWHRF